MKKRNLTKEQLQKLISEGVKKALSNNRLDEKNETKEAPTTTPVKTPSKTPGKAPNPIKIPKPGTFPKPAIKNKNPKKKDIKVENIINEWFQSMKLSEEKIRMKRLISEAPPMDIEPGNDQPTPTTRAGIEGQSETPFSAVELFSKQRMDQSTIEKLGSEEFNAIVRSIGDVGRMQMQEIGNAFNMMMTYERRHKEALENLAKQIVQRKFGLSDDIMDMIDAKLKPANEIDSEDDDETPQEAAEAQFTPEELEVIKKHVDKRIVHNTLMMGAGYRAHKVFDELKNALDGIDERLYPLYNKAMPNVELFMWKIPVESSFGQRQNMGSSKIKCDGDSCKAEAKATIFPILLHEVAKSAVEILFLQHLADVQEKYGEAVGKEVVKQADSYYDEHWLKLIGPRFWKYLHDALTFVVQEEGEDYTIIAYVLNKMASMEPEQFMELMDDTIHDGPRAIEKIKTLVVQIRSEIEAYENQNNEEPTPEDLETNPDMSDEIARLLAQNQEELLTRTPDEERATPPTKKLADMDITELNDELQRALEYEDYRRASQVRDEMNAR